ncbi:MAG: prolipoprotein diacylglyceryl transferase [Anaerolineae bacterium]|nr:prolipoprotein diacylglyceryl transferase [Anaerolineae bacterium]
MESRIALDLGFIKIYWYGIVITLGMMLACYVAMIEAKRRGENPDIVSDGAIWVIGLGLVGARLYHVFSVPKDGSGSGWAYYRDNPLQILAIWQGGIGIYGGILGGGIGIIYVMWRNKAPLWRWFDNIVPGVLLAQAIGRWGNYFNQELYGGPTGSPTWGLIIQEPFRVRTGKFDFTDMQTYPPDTRFHPTFLYESVWNFCGFLLLMWLARRYQQDPNRPETANRPLVDGDIGPLFLIWYGIGRGWVELFFRPDAWTLGALPTAVWVSIFGIIAGILIMIFNRVKVSKLKIKN